MEKVRLGMIGLGGRGLGLLDQAILRMKDIEIVAVCDVYEDRIKQAQKKITFRRRPNPVGYTDYKELLSKSKLDAVIVSCSWKYHTEIAIACMEAGIPTATEVGGAYDIDECWQLIDAYERTKTPYMVLENCCYGEYELMVLNMVRKGLFGEVIHCDGAYAHDLRYEVCYGNKNRHYRLNEYINRNCENYPTHEIGPIAKVLNLGYGNRMVSLTSTASKARGLECYVQEKLPKHPELEELKDTKFKQADIVTTAIKCHNGETIRITLDTTLPRPYSRSFAVHGTKAYYTENGNYMFMDNNPIHHIYHFNQQKFFKNGKRYARKFRHPIWSWFRKGGIKGGHGGMDWLVIRAFFEAVKKGDGIMPLDVYDAASWMVITALSEQSINNNSAPVEFPDFTRGKWQTNKQQGEGMFFLE